MLARDVLELGDQLGVAPDGQVGLHAQLQRGQAPLFQPSDLGRRERQRGDLGQRRPAPERERLVQRRRGLLRVARGQRLATILDAPLEALDIELARSHPQPVAAPGVVTSTSGSPSICADARRAPARS